MSIPRLQSLSIWLKIGLVCVSLGALLFIIGFSTDSWMLDHGRYDHRSYQHHQQQWSTEGLWRQLVCNVNRCDSSRYRSFQVPDFHKATQAMECLGLICQLLAVLLLVLYICVDQCRRRNVMLTVIFFLFAAVGFMVIGFVVFAVKYEAYGYEVGWSMGIAIAGCILVFVAGIMCVMQICAK